MCQLLGHEACLGQQTSSRAAVQLLACEMWHVRCGNFATAVPGKTVVLFVTAGMEVVMVSVLFLQHGLENMWTRPSLQMVASTMLYLQVHSSLAFPQLMQAGLVWKVAEDGHLVGCTSRALIFGDQASFMLSFVELASAYFTPVSFESRSAYAALHGQ